MTIYYTLDANKNPVPCSSVVEYFKWHESMPESSDWYSIKTGMGFSAFQTHIGKSRVSTVYLGFDHGMGSGQILLWETMVFPDTERCERYESYEEAMAGHKKVCKEVEDEAADRRS